MKGVGTLIKIGLHTLMEHEEENTIQIIKEDNKLPNTRNTASYMCCICKYLLYFEIFVVFWCFVDRCFDSFTTPNQNFIFEVCA